MMIVPRALVSAGSRVRSFSTEKPLAVAWFTPIGVVGSGIMGGGIAATAAINGFQVTMVDLNQQILDKSIADITTFGKKMFATQVKKGKMKAAAADKILKEGLARIKTTTDLKALNECGLVVESIAEKLEWKKKLLEDLSKVLQQDSVVGSNTSSLSITELGTYFGRPDKFCGIHFFNPVLVMPLVEIIRTKDSSDRTIQAARHFAKICGKTTVTAKDTPGFIVNRLLVPYLAESALMVDRGHATIPDIDKAMKLGAGMPQGPFQLSDFIGLDTCHSIVSGWMKAYPDEQIFRLPKLLDQKVSEGKLGKKTGEGFYKWQGDKIVG